MKCRYYLFVWWECLSHIKRKKTEEKASVLGRGNNLFNSLPRTILKNRMNSSFSFKSSWCIHPRQGKELNKFFPTNRSDDLCLFSVFILLLWFERLISFLISLSGCLVYCIFSICIYVYTVYYISPINNRSQGLLVHPTFTFRSDFATCWQPAACWCAKL